MRDVWQDPERGPQILDPADRRTHRRVLIAQTHLADEEAYAVLGGSSKLGLQAKEHAKASPVFRVFVVHGRCAARQCITVETREAPVDLLPGRHDELVLNGSYTKGLCVHKWMLCFGPEYGVCLRGRLDAVAKSITILYITQKEAVLPLTP